MKNFKHSKYRNTGIIYNILVKQTIHEVLGSKKSKSLDLIKNYFGKGTELHKEYALYRALSEYKDVKSHSRLANIITEERRNLDNEKLEKEKYDLIGEIKKNYDLNGLFKTELKNYTHLANIYKIFENNAGDNPSEYMDCYEMVLNEISSPPEDGESGDLFEGLNKYYRAIGLNRMVERFNDKYGNLPKKQKDLIKRYIRENKNLPEFKDYVVREAKYIKDSLRELNAKQTNKSLKVKLEEIAKLTDEIVTTNKIRESHITAMFKYYQLIDYLKDAKQNV